MTTRERLIVGAMVAILLVVCADMYVALRECGAAGGTTVRGLFWLECVK